MKPFKNLDIPQRILANGTSTKKTRVGLTFGKVSIPEAAIGRRGAKPFQEGKYKPETQTDKMIAFLESNVAPGKPLFCGPKLYPPHNPFTAPTEFYEHYRGKGVVNPGYYAAVTTLDSYVGRIRQV